jgi:putative ABC transport system ATP-binding protein
MVAAQDVVVRAIELSKEYTLGGETVHALRDVSLDIRRGEYLTIMGLSGSGKSTLFNMIGGLDKPTSGMVFIDDVDIAQLDAYELAWMRCRKIGYIFQAFNLLPTLTALENVSVPMLFAGLDVDTAREKAAEILGRVGLADRVFHRPAFMSGGQQQRVAVARAMANDPAIVLADEPTANLDLRTGEQIIELLKQLSRELRVTIFSATHDHKMLAICDRVAWIRDGAVERIELRKDLDIRVGTIDGSEK